ncbi:hypothetical protein HanPI659440_Chr12g0479241 [Helianthus annuus]|nr:hypothetical protein HanPI659440_Chr12g0479241 [Helianthus annuus]
MWKNSGRLASSKCSRLEKLGWERILDWCEDITPQVYLAAVCEWPASLRFVNRDGTVNTWQLVNDVGRNQMIMSFETMNCIARFDSLGADEYSYYNMDQFFDNKMHTADPEGMVGSVIPYSSGEAALRSDLSVEGKIHQPISLENIMI